MVMIISFLIFVYLVGHLNKFLLVFNRALNMILTLCLITLIFVPFSDHKPLNRLLVIILTTLIIARPESNCVLSSSPVVFLGDISYSVILNYLFYFHAIFRYILFIGLCSNGTAIGTLKRLLMEENSRLNVCFG